MSYFHRFASTLVTKGGTKYIKVLWGTGKCDITIKGVTFRNMSVEEENYLHFTF